MLIAHFSREQLSLVSVLGKLNLVSESQMLGNDSGVTLIKFFDKSKQRYRLAHINVDCPFSQGND